jgi:hypothetical protein
MRNNIEQLLTITGINLDDFFSISFRNNEVSLLGMLTSSKVNHYWGLGFNFELIQANNVIISSSKTIDNLIVRINLCID